MQQCFDTESAGLVAVGVTLGVLGLGGRILGEGMLWLRRVLLLAMVKLMIIGIVPQVAAIPFCFRARFPPGSLSVDGGGCDVRAWPLRLHCLFLICLAFDDTLRAEGQITGGFFHIDRASAA